MNQSPKSKVQSPLCSRRFFIGGAAAFGAFSGCRFFRAAPGSYASGIPNLTFGVVSDIHITKVGAGEQMGAWGNNLTFKHTLEWFRDQGVDAVMVVGDMADTGMVEQLQAVAQAWYAVFPDDKAPDGRRVEKLFVYGNHDYHGYLYGDAAARAYPDEKERFKHVLRADMGGWWKKIFHEDYARLQRKTIKGYTFLGQHWDDGKGPETKYGSCDFGAELQAFFAAGGGKSLDPALPFFYYQHPHPKDTCYGPWAWGHDTGKTTAALSAWSNAVAFSGHSHYSLTDERSVWQGAFTSVGTSSLRYTGMPYDERPGVGYENTNAEGKGAEAVNALKTSRSFDGAGSGDCRQGMLWRVFDDRIVVQRREFLSNLFVGPDWVLPLPSAEPKPFAFAARAKKFNAPAFPAGAKLAVCRTTAKSRGTRKAKGVLKDVLEVTIPAAAADAAARAYAYEIAVAHDGKDAAAKTFHAMAKGFNHATTHKSAAAPTHCSLALERLPAAPWRITVTPYNCWHAKGAALTTTFA